MDNAQKRRIILFCTAGVVLILVVSVLVTINNKKPEKDEKLINPQRTKIILPISSQEIFLPDEPDFSPSVILEREQRSAWSEQDTAQFWQDPLKYGEESWRVEIENSIDKFLENIP